MVDSGTDSEPDGCLVQEVLILLSDPASMRARARSTPTRKNAQRINPRRACARVTVLVLCVCVSVCLSVYPSVPALAASASVETSKQRYSRVSLRLFLD